MLLGNVHATWRLVQFFWRLRVHGKLRKKSERNVFPADYPGVVECASHRRGALTKYYGEAMGSDYELNSDPPECLNITRSRSTYPFKLPTFLPCKNSEGKSLLVESCYACWPGFFRSLASIIFLSTC